MSDSDNSSDIIDSRTIIERLDDSRVPKPSCICGHAWDQHKRQPNGAYGCCHFGCGCRDVVLPK